MGVIVNKGHRVYTGEAEYFPGEFVEGLSAKDEQQLVKDGVCSWTEAPTPTKEVESTTTDLLTPDEFEKLAAADQKKQLEAIQIEPASNKEDRVQQYADWYEQQATGGEDAGVDENGPNTGMTV